MKMQSLLILMLLNLVCASAEPAYPLWSGTETSADYARRVNRPATLTLDCNGVKLETVLVPAGKFTMGAPTAIRPEREPSFGIFICNAGMTVLIFAAVVGVARARRKKSRVQFSLRFIIGATILLGIMVGGAIDAVKMQQAKLRYLLALQYKQGIEQPEHEVTISRPFYMGKLETTQEQFSAVMGSNPSRSYLGTSLPVENVEFADAEAFCAKLSELNHRTVKIPTEAQWEYACRAGTTTRFHSGDADSDLLKAGWVLGNSGGRTHAGGQKAANAFGIHDMHGNAWEWVADWLGKYPNGPVTDPVGPEQGTERVIRGGSWGSVIPNNYRCAHRGTFEVDRSRVSRTGVRVVVTLPDQ